MNEIQAEILQWLGAHLVRLGPGVLFVVCLLETAVFAGLILPVGGMIALAALLSARGLFDPAEIVLVALAGGLIGDQLGFVVGRRFATAARPSRGEIARIWRGAFSRTESLVRRRGLLGITAARAVPFARTVMPWVAGRSGLAWPRFFLFDALGVLLWGTVYIGGGFLAGAGWRHLAVRYGEEVGLLLLGVLATGVLILIRTRLQHVSPRRPALRTREPLDERRTGAEI